MCPAESGRSTEFAVSKTAPLQVRAVKIRATTATSRMRKMADMAGSEMPLSSCKDRASVT